MLDYLDYYRRSVRVDRIAHELPEFDVLVSAYNASTRVKKVFGDVRAKRKVWLIHPEYQFAPIDVPTDGLAACPSGLDEVAQVNALLAEVGDLRGLALCVDITGFMRHTLVFLVAKLAEEGIREFTAIYSEPMYYSKQEHTDFSTTTSGRVRPVRGMAGSTSAHARDYLLVAVGYDHKLIGEVTNAKDSASVYPVFAFPSLSPDMYQQSAVRASDSGDVALGGEWISNRRFAPANDPFSTAGVVREVVRDIDRKESAGSQGNIYLTPLSTKVQALGFALYWHLEGRSRGGVTMLLPECVTYARETSHGLKRLWTYTVELQ